MPWVDTQWARGKTVLVLGDSVTRFMTDYMCQVSTGRCGGMRTEAGRDTRANVQLAGEQGIEIALNHTWAEPLVEAMPPPVPEADRVPEEELRAVATDNNAKRKRSPAVGSGSASVDWSKVHPGKTKSHRPHYCYVPGMDFLMVHVMFFGLDQKEYWKDKVGTSR
jgi:hypothetical protein